MSENLALYVYESPLRGTEHLFIFRIIVKDVLQQRLHFRVPSLQEAAPYNWAVGTCNIQRSQDLLSGACSSKLRFKSSEGTRNAVKCFEIGRNQILIFNLNKYTPKNNTFLSFKVQQVYLSPNACDAQQSSSQLLNYFYTRSFNFKTSYYTGHMFW